MYSQTFGSRAALTLSLLALLAAGAYTAAGQNPSTPASPDKPVIPASRSAQGCGQGRATYPRRHSSPAGCPDVRKDSYIIGSDDMLAINVWKEPEMSKGVPVRPDGMISLPLLGEIKARGLTPVQLEESITDSLKKIMSDPQVTVIVSQVNSLASTLWVML